MVYPVFLLSSVLVGIATAITAAEEASRGDTGWALVWGFISGACFLTAYYLVKS
jgi:hypothetical protein